jgi:hypothetical protein
VFPGVVSSSPELVPAPAFWQITAQAGSGLTAKASRSATAAPAHSEDSLVPMVSPLSFRRRTEFCWAERRHIQKQATEREKTNEEACFS